mmetsp:Transcript_43471/g.75568  ORF Transcript_43471/g.75568 Transcript_43471/m.75568 type:complete len:240 (-) Transcript_43471:217-936(-)
MVRRVGAGGQRRRVRAIVQIVLRFGVHHLGRAQSDASTSGTRRSRGRRRNGSSTQRSVLSLQKDLLLTKSGDLRGEVVDQSQLAKAAALGGFAVLLATDLILSEKDRRHRRDRGNRVRRGAGNRGQRVSTNGAASLALALHDLHALETTLLAGLLVEGKATGARNISIFGGWEDLFHLYTTPVFYSIERVGANPLKFRTQQVLEWVGCTRETPLLGFPNCCPGASTSCPRPAHEHQNSA